MAQGFAWISNEGEIDIATVSPSELGAKVNAIVRLSGGAIIPRDSWADAEIDNWLGRVARGHGAIRAVNISIASH